MTNYVTDHSHFRNQDDLNEAARQHKHANWHNMNETDRDMLDMIRRHSAKLGAAQLTHNTIESTIGKSNATVRRTMRKLVQLGIIDRTHYIRPIMSGLGANIYAIKPFKESPEMEST